MIKKWIYIAILALFISSCMDDEDWYDLNNPIDIELRSPGVFIVNEGNFTYDNASLSYYRIDSMKVLNDVFLRTNNVPMGDVAQSMTIRDSLGYIVVNNSGKIYIIDTRTFELKGKITGFVSPRYMHFISDTKAYVSDQYAGAISIINPEAMKITGKIELPPSPFSGAIRSSEQMVKYKKFVFINCWSFGNQVLVVDSETDEIVDSIETGIQPNSMVLDRHDKLWVLTDGGYKGNPYGHEKPQLLKINAQNRQVEDIFYFAPENSPSELSINGSRDTIYFINRHIYRHAVLFDSEPEILIQSNYQVGYFGGYYGLGIDPVNSDIYVADALDHNQRGKVFRFSNNAAPLDTFNVGIIPGEFCFRSR